MAATTIEFATKLLEQERPDGRLVIVPDLGDEAMFAQWGANLSSVENYKQAVTPEEFAVLEAQHGLPDSEG
jgi:hypothetical protein